MHWQQLFWQETRTGLKQPWQEWKWLGRRHHNQWWTVCKAGGGCVWGCAAVLLRQEWCWAGLTHSQGFSAPHPTPLAWGDGRGISQGGGKDEPSDCRDAPDCVEWRQINWGEQEEGRGVLFDGTCLPKSLFHVMEPWCPGDAEHLPARPWEVVNLAWLVCAVLLYL